MWHWLNILFPSDSLLERHICFSSLGKSFIRLKCANENSRHLLDAYYVPSMTVALCQQLYLILLTTLWSEYCYSSFTEEGTEVQGNQTSCLCHTASRIPRFRYRFALTSNFAVSIVFYYEINFQMFAFKPKYEWIV